MVKGPAADCVPVIKLHRINKNRRQKEIVLKVLEHKGYPGKGVWSGAPREKRQDQANNIQGKDALRIASKGIIRLGRTIIQALRGRWNPFCLKFVKSLSFGLSVTYCS